MKMKRNWYWRLSIAILWLFVFQLPPLSVAQEVNPYVIQSDNPYLANQFVVDGEVVDEVIVPSRPPELFTEIEAVVPESSAAAGTNSISNVPAFDWSYGCAATSAAMMFGYYDNTGYPNIYTGPTNGGVIPMTNAVWGKGECPLSATHQGIDGRAIKGHVDDYYITYGSTQPDPFIGNWTEHTWGDCTGDYMGTNQSQKSNTDGSTTFYYYNNGNPTNDFTSAPSGHWDGCHGMKLFFESRGYTVVSNYSQYIKGYNGLTNGFTFDQYKQEIDAGRPVLIQMDGHTMIGYGYNNTGSIVYLHDTWDYSAHSMTWGGAYGSNPVYHHIGVTVFVPSAPASSNPVPDIKANGQDGSITVSSSTDVSITAGLTPGNQSGTNADWWVVYNSPTGWHSLTTNGWVSGIAPLITYPLFGFSPVQIINQKLPAGSYAFYFAVDTKPDGVLNTPLYYDGVQVNVVNPTPTPTPTTTPAPSASHLMTKWPLPSTSSCITPTQVSTFKAGDTAVSWAVYYGVVQGDSITWKWYPPSGSSYTSTYKTTWSGNGCTWSYAPVNATGAWHIEVLYNGIHIYDEYFNVTN